MSEEIDKHVLRKYNIQQKLGKGVSWSCGEAALQLPVCCVSAIRSRVQPCAPKLVQGTPQGFPGWTALSWRGGLIRGAGNGAPEQGRKMAEEKENPREAGRLLGQLSGFVSLFEGFWYGRGKLAGGQSVRWLEGMEVGGDAGTATFLLGVQKKRK